MSLHVTSPIIPRVRVWPQSRRHIQPALRPCWTGLPPSFLFSLALSHFTLLLAPALLSPSLQ
ncbi:hypothetical protein CGRA01v4_08593 [Colletotrichum graminicola]|nr:hypothetical protein CGRA01v4_08593 [Colletotrichum graminicola]